MSKHIDNIYILHLRNPYSESMKEMLKTFGTATYKVGLKVHPNEEDPRVPIMCWGSCAYTIQTIGNRLLFFSVCGKSRDGRSI